MAIHSHAEVGALSKATYRVSGISSRLWSGRGGACSQQKEDGGKGEWVGPTPRVEPGEFEELLARKAAKTKRAMKPTERQGAAKPRAAKPPVDEDDWL